MKKKRTDPFFIHVPFLFGRKWGTKEKAYSSSFLSPFSLSKMEEITHFFFLIFSSLLLFENVENHGLFLSSFLSDFFLRKIGETGAEIHSYSSPFFPLVIRKMKEG